MLALAGCHKAPDKTAEQKNAAGQILQASASDAMLPYDTVKSHPPLAPRVIKTEGAAPGEAAADSAPAADSAASDAPPPGETGTSTPAPAAPPVPLLAPAQ